MTLARMIAMDENALICDFAETYGVFDFRKLPIRLAAILAAGLREDSRVKRKMWGIEEIPKQILLCSIADVLKDILYVHTKEWIKGIDRPKHFSDYIYGRLEETTSSDVVSFSSVEEFEEERRKTIEGY